MTHPCSDLTLRTHVPGASMNHYPALTPLPLWRVLGGIWPRPLFYCSHQWLDWQVWTRDLFIIDNWLHIWLTLLHVYMCVKVSFWLHLLSDYLHVHLKIRIVVYTIAGTIITNSFFMRWFVVKIYPIRGNDTTLGKLFCNLIPV